MKKKIFLETKTRMFLFGPLTVLAVGLVLAGCASSYRGQYDTSVPLSEQATLKIPGELKVAAFDDNSLGFWGWGRAAGERFGGTLYANFPAGEHTFTFDHMKIMTSTSGNYRTTTTSSASGMTATVVLEPGHTYYAMPRHYGGNRIGVDIIEEKAEEPQDTFSAPEIQAMYKLGGKLSVNDEYYSIPIDFGAALRLGKVFDGKTKQGWHIDLGIDLTSLLMPAVSVSTGAAYEYYIPKTDIGFSIGGAMNYVTDFNSVVFYPNIRLEFIPWRRSAKFGLYGDYNFSNSIKIVPWEEEENTYLKTDSIGFGIFYSF
jgi:hypothetical protein